MGDDHDSKSSPRLGGPETQGPEKPMFEASEKAANDAAVNRFEQTTVASMAPPHSKHRDALILIVAAVILVAVLIGGYFLLRQSETVLQKFVKDPVGTVTKLFRGYQMYEVCESYLKENETRFQQMMGKDVGYRVINQEVRVVNRRKTANLTIRAQGSAGRGDIFFRLQKSRGRWRIESVAIRTGKGKYERLYPSKKST